jgi:hypothetical protein
MNEEIKSIFMPNNKYNTLVIERPVMGNFKKGVGEDDVCYTKCWQMKYNDNFKWVINDDGSEIYCVCVSSSSDITSLELKSEFLYNSEISFKCVEVEKDIVWKFNVFDKNGKKKIEKIENEMNVYILEGDNVVFSVQISECEAGKCLFVIKDLKCVTIQNTTVKIPVKSMLSVISTSIRSEIKNMLSTK